MKKLKPIKKFIFYFIFLTINFYSIFLNAQNVPYFQKIIGDNTSQDINEFVPTSDGGIIATGQTFSDSPNGDVYVVKMDIHGQIQWSKQFGGNEMDRGLSVIEIVNDGYLVCGQTQSAGIQRLDGMAIKLDENGNQEWTNSFEASDLDNAFVNAGMRGLQTADGGYLLAGSASNFAPGLERSNIYIVKLNSTGILEWSKVYGGSSNDWVRQIIPTADGNFLVLGTSFSNPSFGFHDAVLFKMDMAGAVIWSKHIGTDKNDSAGDIIELDNGELMVSLSVGDDALGVNAQKYKHGLVKLAADGTRIWSKTYTGGIREQAHSVQRTTDNGFLLAGRTNSFSPNGDYDAFLLKTTGNGTLLHSKVYGGDGEEVFGGASVTSEAFQFMGATSSFGSGDNDIYYLRTDTTGNVPNNCYSRPNTWVEAPDFIQVGDFTYSTNDINISADVTFTTTDSALPSQYVCPTETICSDETLSFSLIRQAMVNANNDNCIDLTNTSGQSTAFWNNEPIDLSEPFHFFASVYLGDIVEGSGGVTFVLQNEANPTQASGTNTGLLGYSGISPSIAIEIDTWDNGDFNDITKDHIAVNISGDPASVSMPIDFPDLPDDQYHDFEVHWEPITNTLTFALDGIEDTYQDDIVANIFSGNSQVYWGMTGGTGINNNVQRVCGLEMTNCDCGDCDTDQDSLGGEYFKNQLIVQLDPSTTESEKIAMRAEFQATMLDECLCGRLELWEVPRTIVVEGLPVVDIEEKETEVKKKTKVEDTGRNYLMKFNELKSKKVEETPPNRSNTADNLNYKSRVAVIDTGIDYEQLESFIWSNPDPANDGNCLDDPNGFDFVNDSNDPIDDNGHGTGVAGRVLNGHRGVVVDFPESFDLSVANNMELMNIKAYSGDRGNLWNLVCALFYAKDMGADVVSCSMGYVGEESEVLKRTIRALQDDCVLVVASAGNEGINTDVVPHFPSGHDLENVISVAATDGYYTGLSGYSNRGVESVDVAFPGSAGVLQPGGEVAFKKGTSYASAAVAGIAAMLKSEYPEATYLDIKNAILNSVYQPENNLELATGGVVDYIDAQTELEIILQNNSSACICLPVLYCQDIEVALTTETVTIDAEELDNGSYSNCAAGPVQFSFSGDVNDNNRTFDCGAVGVQTLELWVTDSGNHQDMCQVQVNVEDPNGMCPQVIENCPNTLVVESPIVSGTYVAGATVESDDVVPAGTEVTYMAGTSIELQPGFEVELTAEFTAVVTNMFCVDPPETENRQEILDVVNNVVSSIKIQPNPFSKYTQIEYQLPEKEVVFMVLSDITGRTVRYLVNGLLQEKGTHQLELQATNLEQGIYFITLITPKNRQTQKLVIMK